MGSTDVVETVRYKLKESDPVTISGLVNMQDMTTKVCRYSELGEAKTLTDLRDGNTYSVVRLADGKCWMTENLKLKLNADTLPLKGTSADGKTSDLPEGAEWDPGSSWYTVESITNNSSDTGTLSWNNGNGHGTYWQWNAATAGQGNSVTSGGVNTSQSVCPKEWRLPSSGDFTALYNAYNTPAKLTSAPARFTYSGGVFSGSLSSVGSWGYYWSSTSRDSVSANRLYFIPSSIYPSGNYDYLRRYGFPVRCVAR